MNTRASARDEKFIDYLMGLASKEDRVALATLRRGISSSPEHEIGMYRFVASWVGSDEHHWSEECLYLIAALFAHYPGAKSAKGNFGESVRLLKEAKNSESIERRFVALLAADTHAVRAHLRYMSSLLKTESIGVNWLSLLHDLRRWQHPARYVERAWAREFWRKPPQVPDRDAAPPEQRKTDEA